MVYSAESSALITHRGAPFIFGYRHALSGIGAISKHSIIPVGRRHYGWGPDGIFQTDGTSFQFIDTPVRQWIRDNLNTNQSSKIWGYHEESDTEVIWDLPTGANTEPSESIGFNYTNGAWSHYDYARTASIPRAVWGGSVRATADGGVFVHGSGVNANGAALAASIRTKPFGDGLSWQYFDAVLLKIKNLAGTGVQARIGWSEKIDDDINWGPWQEVVSGFEPHFHDIE